MRHQFFIVSIIVVCTSCSKSGSESTDNNSARADVIGTSAFNSTENLATEALSALESIQQKTFMQCTKHSTGEKFLFAKVLTPNVPPNDFTPALAPQEGVNPGTVGGFYQFALFRNTQGNYISQINQVSLEVTDADHRNKIDARYQINLAAQSYRIYTVATSSWSEWTNAGSFGKNVDYGSFNVYRKDGQWIVDGGYLINTNGQLQAAACTEIPPG